MPWSIELSFDVGDLHWFDVEGDHNIWLSRSRFYGWVVNDIVNIIYHLCTHYRKFEPSSTPLEEEVQGGLYKFNFLSKMFYLLSLSMEAQCTWDVSSLSWLDPLKLLKFTNVETPIIKKIAKKLPLVFIFIDFVGDMHNLSTFGLFGEIWIFGSYKSPSYITGLISVV